MNYGVNFDSGAFDGRGGYVEVPSNVSLKFVTGDFALCAWIYSEKKSTMSWVMSSTCKIRLYLSQVLLKEGERRLVGFRAQKGPPGESIMLKPLSGSNTVTGPGLYLSFVAKISPSRWFSSTSVR